MCARVKTNDEADNYRGRSSKRKYGKFSRARLVAVSLIVFLALMIFIIFYGVVLERMENLQQIIALNRRHKQLQIESPAEADENAGGRPSTVPPISDVDSIESGQIVAQHGRFQFLRRRLSRDLSGLIERQVTTGASVDFVELYGRVRNKRAHIELQKLQNEYKRCEKRSAMSGGDCMVYFVKLYKMAEDISAKMEKMKEIFKNSDLVLDKNSSSMSGESSEKVKNATTTMTEAGTTTEIVTTPTPTSTPMPTTTTTMMTPTTTTITNVDKFQLHKVSPIKISWILDGHDEGSFPYAPDHMATTTTIASTSTSADVEVSTTTTVITSAVTTTATPPTPELRRTEAEPEFDDVTETSTIDDVTTEGLGNSTAEASAGEQEISTTDDAGDSTFEGSTTDATRAEDEEILRKLKQDWTTDDDGGAVTDQPDGETTADSAEFTALLRTVKLTESPGVTVTYSGHCSSTAGECSRTTIDTATTARRPTTTPMPPAAVTDDFHILDDPSSLENMLDSFERHEDLKPKIEELRMKAAAVNATAAKANRYNEEEWEKAIKAFGKSQGQGQGQGQAEHRPQHQEEEELIDSFGMLDAKSTGTFGPKLNTVNGKGFNAADAQLMTLCERMAQRVHNKGGGSSAPSVPESEPAKDTFTHAPAVQFTSRGPGGGGGGFPVTGETMKASAQFMFNPNFGMPTVPICFYLTPATYRMYNPPAMWPASLYGMGMGMGMGMGGGGGGGFPAAPFMAGGGPGGIFFVPNNYASTGGNFFSHTGGPSGSQISIPNIFSKNASPQKVQHQQLQQQFYCTYMQANQANNPGGGGGGVGGGGGGGGSSLTGSGIGGVGFTNANFKMRSDQQRTTVPSSTSIADIIYASYAGMPPAAAIGHTEPTVCSVKGQVACYGGNECVPADAWCDNAVDCSDGSDETACTCRHRLDDERQCDGYPDCPMGEDEIGCFGCDGFMFSCYATRGEYERFNRSTVSMCYSAMEKCDGVMNCLNGRDESECSMLVSDLTHHMSHSVSSSEGFLYRNYRGEWYPVCNNGEKWAREACSGEGVIDDATTNITHRAMTLTGPFIEPSILGNPLFPQSCQKRDGANALTDHVTYVRCASPKCGVPVKAPGSGRSRSKRYERSVELATAAGQRSRTAAGEDGERIVGGTQAKPQEWPFVVALYRNGNFHCGGTIYTERWIISAAHCVINYHKYHYEVRAGVLRRSSYSMATQIQPISHIVVHHHYERRTMRNDLALLRVAEPLRFNRWVMPICLPEQERTGVAGDDWMDGPAVNTLCLVVGWGAVREKGPGSDHLRQVAVPIRANCTEKEDQDAEDICAGDESGGRDACQGDSGGPLFCPSASNPTEWYLAGVVSHGNGCARPGEYGVYTRVAIYRDWILAATASASSAAAAGTQQLPAVRPLELCPGYMCVWGGKHCISQRRRCDRVIDCLGGEDEVGCVYNFTPEVGSTKNVTTHVDDYDPDEAKASTAMEAATAAVTDDATTSLGNGMRSEEAAATTVGIEIEEAAEIATTATTTGATITTTGAASVIAATKTTTTMPTTTISTDSVELGEALESTTDNPTDSTETPPDITIETAEHPRGVNLVTTTTATTLVTRQASTDSPLPPPPPLSSNGDFPTPAEEFQKLKDLAEQVKQQRNASTTVAATTEVDSTSTSASTPLDLLGSVRDVAEVEATTEDSSRVDATTTNSGHDVDGSRSPERNETDQGRAENDATLTNPEKFMCGKIPQVIDRMHRCDRLIDCEDGTDERNCTCRDYLKGPLNILVCDGKADCEDLSDESDCGKCQDDEFLCGLSKTCVPMSKRCDNVIDCKFHEDEQNCFALTNGKNIALDVNRQPILNNVGIFSRNIHGTWRIVCSHETAFHMHSAKTAAEVCALLGFKGFRFYNSTEILSHDRLVVPIHPAIAKAPGIRSRMDLSAAIADNGHVTHSGERKFMPALKLSESRERVEKFNENLGKCLGIYVECIPKANRTRPLKTLSAGMAIKSKALDSLPPLQPTVQTHGRPNVFMKPEVPPLVVDRRDEIMKKLDKVLDSRKNVSVLAHDQLHEAIEDLHWPWLVDVYRNGRLWCVGVLLDKHWVLVHESCHFDLSPRRDYVAALMGGGKTKNAHHKSANEQIRRIDCVEIIPKGDVMLYHLEQPVRYTHHVLPTFIPDPSPDSAATNASRSHNVTIGADHCMAVLHDNRYGRIKSVSIREHTADELCKNVEVKCFRLEAKEPSVRLMEQTQLSAEDLATVSVEVSIESVEDVEPLALSLSPITTCSEFGEQQDSAVAPAVGDPVDQGVVVCRDGETGWYPAAMFDYNNTDCSSFREPFVMQTLEKVYSSLEEIIDRPSCEKRLSAPACPTHRCPLGACLEAERLCDGRNDCHDGSDEEPLLCRRVKQACAPDELKCRSSNKCVPKTKFCDHVPDCEDLTDEPTICSCFTYLKATDPSKICDGIRNCWDKSDESPVLCNCTEGHFACGGASKECIPRDFVCDKEYDCPKGEDEQFCFGIEHPIRQDPKTEKQPKPPSSYSPPPKFGQVIEQTYGIWHTKCFPRSSPPDMDEVRRICKQLGYNPHRLPSYRLIDDATNAVVETSEVPDQRGRSFGDPADGGGGENSDSVAGRYRESTKAMVVSKFSPLRLNDVLTLFLKPSRPLAQLVRWNATDSSKCFRLELRCA